jgi:predicted phage terminase large subunit-like protein
VKFEIPEELKTKADRLRWCRWKGRTDLRWLCANVLGEGFNDPDYLNVLEPVINALQPFPMAWEESGKYDKYTEDLRTGRIKWDFWRPLKERKQLPGPWRRRLILDPRSSGKTSMNSRAHTIQWILNFPDIAICITQAKHDKAEDLVSSIANLFIHNKVFRDLYPEYCPNGPGEIKAFGNRQRFTVPNRRLKSRIPPTVYAASIEGSMSGYHFEVMKYSDIVDKENTKTEEGIRLTASNFYNRENLLEDPDDWIDVEGTRYHMADFYGRVIEDEQRLPAEQRLWYIHVRGVYVKDTGIDPETGQRRPETFLPEELDLDPLKDENGQLVSRSPRWKTWQMEIERRRNAESDWEFATQKLNNPMEQATKARTFPLEYYKEITPEQWEEKKRHVAYRQVTVDTASSQGKRSDYSVITCVAVDSAGRRIVEDVRRGRMLYDELVNTLFEFWLKHSPRVIKIEETQYVTGLKPTIERECAKRRIWPAFEWIKRDTQVSKEDRIKGIQPWYKNGDLLFLSDLTCREALQRELNQFPQSAHDDILDTIADQFQGEDWFHRNQVRRTAEEELNIARVKMFQPSLWDEERPERSSYWDKTGGL